MLAAQVAMLDIKNDFTEQDCAGFEILCDQLLERGMSIQRFMWVIGKFYVVRAIIKYGNQCAAGRKIELHRNSMRRWLDKAII